MELIAPQGAQATRSGILGARCSHLQAGRFRKVSGNKEALRHLHIACGLRAWLHFLKRLAQNRGNIRTGEKQASSRRPFRIHLGLRLRLSLIAVLVADESCVLRRTCRQPGNPQRGAKHYAQRSQKLRAKAHIVFPQSNEKARISRRRRGHYNRDRR
jgi:hypothetical protein